MILLDTHIWIWWIEGSPRLTSAQNDFISNGTGWSICMISCWELAKLVAARRMSLNLPILDWIEAGTLGTSVEIIDLTKEIAVEANNLPTPFHRDPVDQIIVATARILNVPLLTADAKILSYPHVQLLV